MRYVCYKVKAHVYGSGHCFAHVSMLEIEIHDIGG